MHYPRRWTGVTCASSILAKWSVLMGHIWVIVRTITTRKEHMSLALALSLERACACSHAFADLPDEQGPRFCINLCAIAGRPPITPQTAIAGMHQANVPSPSPGAIHSRQPELKPAERSKLSVAIVALSGDGLVVGHRHEGAADAIAEVVRKRLALPRAAVVADLGDPDPWSAIRAVAVIIVIVEVDSNGDPSDSARQWMRRLKAAICEGDMQTGGALTGKYLSLLALASSVCVPIAYHFILASRSVWQCTTAA